MDWAYAGFPDIDMSTRRSTNRMVLVTAPSRRVGRAIARAVLEARAVACVNLVAGVESHYWWQGKLERGAEVLLVMKTTADRLEELERLVIALHPYDTPEFVVLDITGGNRRYLDWIRASTRPEGTAPAR